MVRWGGVRWGTGRLCGMRYGAGVRWGKVRWDEVW